MNKYFSNEEKQMMDRLFGSINKNPSEVYILTFSNGDVIEAQADTCFETDNRLDDDDPNYEEYHACAMEVVRIIADKNKMLKEGQLIEINYHNYPQQIIDSQGNVL